MFTGILPHDCRISIHALLAESDSMPISLCCGCFISIHALLAESDETVNVSSHGDNNFYPRSPCGERRGKVTDGYDQNDFYPRSPCGERPFLCTSKINMNNFYPRSPCGERLTVPDLGKRNIRISIHALLAESDVTVLGIQHRVGISIHALLAESDLILIP